MNTPSPDASARLARLAADLEPFQRFARSRLHDDDLAAEAVQEALVKATRHAGALRDDQDLVAWFWTILRRAIADLVADERTRARRHAALTELEDPHEAPPDACACLHAVIDGLPGVHAEVLRAVDLGGEEPTAVAMRFGINVGALAVRRHRARAALAEAMARTCRTCAVHGCVDCSCREPATA